MMDVVISILVYSLVLNCSILYTIAHIGRMPERKCYKNREWTANDEADDEAFLEKLEEYTGLSNKNMTISVTCEGKSVECTIDSQGELIWIARKILYQKYSNDKELACEHITDLQTIDGCLCCTQTKIDYQKCMESVRNNMLVDLNDIMIKTFKEKLQEDCKLLKTNCVGK